MLFCSFNLSFIVLNKIIRSANVICTKKEGISGGLRGEDNAESILCGSPTNVPYCLIDVLQVWPDQLLFHLGTL